MICPFCKNTYEYLVGDYCYECFLFFNTLQRIENTHKNRDRVQTEFQKNMNAFCLKIEEDKRKKNFRRIEMD